MKEQRLRPNILWVLGVSIALPILEVLSVMFVRRCLRHCLI